MTSTACRPDGHRQFGGDRPSPRRAGAGGFSGGDQAGIDPADSTATCVELGIVALGRRGEAGLEQMQALLDSLRLETVPVSTDHARIAIDAFRRFGKGRHAAALNYGDCFSYALARATGEPLLFKGEDFSLTDVVRAV